MCMIQALLKQDCFTLLTMMFTSISVLYYQQPLVQVCWAVKIGISELKFLIACNNIK